MPGSKNAFDEIANLLASGTNPESLISYEIPQYLVNRYEMLVEKEKEGGITEEEKRELDSLLMINHVISLAKLIAMKKLAAA